MVKRDRDGSHDCDQDRQRPPVVNRLPPQVKLGSYRGDTCHETFLARFENLSEYMEWKERDRLFHLKACLEGPAGQILWDAGPQTSVADVIRLLRARFGTKTIRQKDFAQNCAVGVARRASPCRICIMTFAVC